MIIESNSHYRGDIMDVKDTSQAVRDMFNLALHIGQTEMEQQALVKALKKIDTETVGYVGKEKLLRMLGLFYDGLAYGNWPWPSKY